MSYHLNRRWGDADDNATIEQMREALAELDAEDIEHCDVSLTHETGWCLEAYYTGLVVWEHLGGGEPRHMHDVARDRVLEMWQNLAKGDFAAIDAEPWKPGYG